MQEHPLVVRCGALGDMVLLTAFIRVLAERYQCAVDILTSGPWSRPLLEGQPGVGSIFSLRSRKTPYVLSWEQQRTVRALRRRGAGPTWYCDGDAAARGLLVRACVPAGLMVDVQDHRLMPGEHATEQWRRLAQVDPHDAPHGRVADLRSIAPGCSLDVLPAQRLDFDRWRARRGLADLPLLAIQIGNKRTMRRGFKRLAANHKHWPMERWTQVLRFLRQRHPAHAIVLLGAAPESALNAQLAEFARIDGVHNLADDLPVPRLVALLAAADGLVSVDSGPAHVAAAVGCPQVVLFGRALPSLYRPWGVSGADVRVLVGEVAGRPDMLGIEASSVIEAWSTLVLRGG
jgi:ADP-heptose:LPS heptosyltransferase